MVFSTGKDSPRAHMLFKCICSWCLQCWRKHLQLAYTCSKCHWWQTLNIRENVFIYHHLSQYCCKRHLLNLIKHQLLQLGKTKGPRNTPVSFFMGPGKEESPQREQLGPLQALKRTHRRKKGSMVLVFTRKLGRRPQWWADFLSLLTFDSERQPVSLCHPGMHVVIGAKGQDPCGIILHLPSRSCPSLTELSSEKVFSGLFISALGCFTSKLAGLVLTLG